MQNCLMSHYRYAVKAIAAECRASTEFARSMAPHPLDYQEMAHDPEYMLYNDRLSPSKFADVTDEEMYWKVRTEVILRNTVELPIEIVGPDAEHEVDGEDVQVCQELDADCPGHHNRQEGPVKRPPRPCKNTTRK